LEGVTIFDPVGKLDAIIGQDGMDFVGNSGNEMAQELSRDRPRRPLGKGELGGSVNGDKQVQLAFFGAHFSNVNVKVADGVFLEAFFLR
jgi:hypothetical protein